jgi:hypothetical protein
MSSPTPNTPTGTMMLGGDFGTMSSLQLLHMLKEWEIDLNEIEFRKRIGRGMGGMTYLAKWSGQNAAV